MTKTRMKRLWKRFVGWLTWCRSDRDVNRAWRRIYAEMARERAQLERELELHAFDVSPAMVQARNDQLANENTGLRAYADRLRVWGDELDQLVEAPDRNCSCHICAPCNDCVDYGNVREVKRGWKEAKEAKP